MNSFELTPSTLSLLDQTLADMVRGYNTMQLERKKMLEENIPEENPQIKAKNAELEKLRNNILESLRNLQVGYNSSIEDYYRRKSS